MAQARTLTPDAQARTLDKLRALERAAMFTPDDALVRALVAEWSFAVRVGSLRAADVAAIAAEFDRWGIGPSSAGRTPRRAPSNAPGHSRRPAAIAAPLKRRPGH